MFEEVTFVITGDSVSLKSRIGKAKVVRQIEFDCFAIMRGDAVMSPGVSKSERKIEFGYSAIILGDAVMPSGIISDVVFHTLLAFFTIIASAVPACKRSAANRATRINTRMFILTALDRQIRWI